MTYDRGRRRAVLNIALDKLRANPFFREVHARFPGHQLPGADMMPSAFVARNIESPEWRTNSEGETDFQFAVFGFVWSEEDLELTKIDAQDEIEASILGMMLDADFLAEADLIDIPNIDPGPLALSQFGLELEVEPPIGVVRVDCRVTIIYTRL